MNFICRIRNGHATHSVHNPFFTYFCSSNTIALADRPDHNPRHHPIGDRSVQTKPVFSSFAHDDAVPLVFLTVKIIDINTQRLIGSDLLRYARDSVAVISSFNPSPSYPPSQYNAPVTGGINLMFVQTRFSPSLPCSSQKTP